MRTAKLFKNGRSQAVRLPKEFRFGSTGSARHANWSIGYTHSCAAQAISLDVTLVTNNVREFSRVQGLRFENWVDG